MNLVGAAGFVINGWWHGAIPSASLNIVWMFIAAFSLWRIWQRRSSTSAPVSRSPDGQAPRGQR
jgi:hypothetical protein